MSEQPENGQPEPAATPDAEAAPEAVTEATPEAAPGVEREPEQRLVRVRRAPRYLPFAITGFALGAVIGLLVAQLPAEQVQTQGQQLQTRSPELYFVLGIGLIGVLAGLTLALLLERRQR